MKRPSPLYGLLQRGVEDRRAPGAMSHSISIQARFPTGKTVLAEGRVVSWALLRDKGRPNTPVYSKVVRPKPPTRTPAVRSRGRHTDRRAYR